jgi:hypothetical protein
MFHRPLNSALPALVLWTLLPHCQAYPFEARPAQRVQGRLVSQQVANLTPTDILFVIDDSGSMLTKRTELARNIGRFIDGMAHSGVDYHVGLITTDVECNIPERNCPGDQVASNSSPATTSLSCCALAAAAQAPRCSDYDLNGDSQVDFTTCNGGRLRAPRGRPATWLPPPPAQAAKWVDDFSATVLNLGCEGSGLESGLEAARRAVSCSVNGFNPNALDVCPSLAIAQLNAGFIRPQADLVLIFVSDEDDCSFLQPSVYARPQNPASILDQAAHLCSPQECYAYYGADTDGNGLQDWIEPGSPTGSLLTCPGSTPNTSSSLRQVNPPRPDAVSTYLRALVAAKGGDVRRVRAAGIVSGFDSRQRALGLEPGACTASELGASALCGCWSASLAQPVSSDFYCSLTQTLHQGSTPSPQQSQSNNCSQLGANSGSSAPLPGCTSMPSGRYVAFLEALAAQRTAAMARPDTLATSICQPTYQDTMNAIVNSIVLTSCFALQEVPPDANAIVVRQNGKLVPRVPVGSQDLPGWSMLPGAQEICLEGGLKKSLGDSFSIFIVDAQSTASNAPQG